MPRSFLLLLVFALSCLPMYSDTGTASERVEILDLPLDQLMRVKVTTASRKSEEVFNSPAAVYVIGGEEIRRSGVTTIAEALRLAPGVQVARLNPREWAISARGFNGQYANKLLVLVDGRTVYSPLNSGVNWETVDTLLEDIDRIEVVRGPGGALWGANAVNGVINIITKDSQNTQGFHAEAGGGTFERAFGGFRYGGRAGDVAFRVYGKYFDRADFPVAGGGSDENDWSMGQGGFRADWNPREGDAFTLQGDFYRGSTHEVVSRVHYVSPYFESFRNDVDLTGGNVLGRWTHDYEADAQTQVQTYYDRAIRDHLLFSEDIQTFDADLQHRFFLGERHDIVAGLGYRLIATDLSNGPNVRFNPEDRILHLPSAFLQDEISLLPDTLTLTVGTKLEHHYFSGWEILPTGRLLWKPHEKQTLWASVSRASRTPSIGEHDIRADFAVDPGPPLTVYAADVSGRLKPEEVTAYELGYRFQPLDRLMFDAAAFYNVYENFLTFEPGTPYVENIPGPPHIVFPFDAQNKAYGETYGIEFATSFKATDWWRLDASYTYLQIQLHNRNSLEPSAEFAEKESPHHQFVIRSAFDLPGNFQLDWIVRYVDALPGFDVPSYITSDLRLAWAPSKQWELALVGQNLFNERHVEFRNPSTLANVQSGSEVPRGVYGKVTWKF